MNNTLYQFYSAPQLIPSILPKVPYHMVVPSGKGGIVLGYQGCEFAGIPFGSEGNTLVLGGPGCGKTSGIFLPTLRSWNGAFVVTDIKGDLEKNFVPHSGNSRKVVSLNPDDPLSLSVDPFDWLKIDGKENLLSNVTALASIIIPTDEGASDPFWTASERAVLAAALLCYYNAGLSFPQAITRALDLSLVKLCEELGHFADNDANRLMGGLAKMKAETICSIERGLRNKLLAFTNENKLLHFFRGYREGASVFSLTELDDTLLFIRIPSEKVERWGAGVTLLLTMILQHLERRPDAFTPEAAGLSPMLIAVDEFPRFGRLPMIAASLATLRSKGVNIMLAVQSISQLSAIYGHSGCSTIIDCCSFRAILRVDDPVNQRLIADMIGVYPAYYQGDGACWNQNGILLSYTTQITMRPEYIVQPAGLASVNSVFILSPYGTFIAEKLPPISSPKVLLQDTAHKGSEGVFPPVDRSAEAKRCVDEYLRRHAKMPITSENAAIDGRGFNRKKDRVLDSKSHLSVLRAQWAAVQNKEYERFHLPYRVSPKKEPAHDHIHDHELDGPSLER